MDPLPESRARDPASVRRLRVAFVAGLGRSGSTLLDRILGQVPGCVNMGEASQIWRALSTGVRCGCGRPTRECPFWSAVIPTVLASWSAADQPEVALAEAWQLQRRVDRLRYLGALTVPAQRLPVLDHLLGRRRLQRDVARYADLLATLYAVVAAATGAAVVIDSGKHTSTAFLLRRVPDIDLRVIHLVRDPRGVAYSWTKVVRKSQHSDAPEMPRQRPSRVARRWLLHNMLLRVLGLLRVPTYFLRYEDLVSQPRARVADVGRFLGLDAAATAAPFLSDRVVDLRRADHTLAGNPMRFHHDPITVSLDDTWRSDLPSAQRRLVTALTAPLLVAYGYRMCGKRAGR